MTTQPIGWKPMPLEMQNNPVSEPRYLCQRCGNCCRWPGFVRIDENEIAAIADFLGVTPDEFIARHTDLRPSRSGLMLKSNPDGSCIFLQGLNTCTIQPVKPQQCRDFPNKWRFDGWREKCEAIEVSDPEVGRPRPLSAS